MRRCVQEKGHLRIFAITYSLWWPSLIKDLRTKPKKKCCALVWLDRRRMPGSCEQTIIDFAENFISMTKATITVYTWVATVVMAGIGLSITTIFLLAPKTETSTEIRKSFLCWMNVENAENVKLNYWIGWDYYFYIKRFICHRLRRESACRRLTPYRWYFNLSCSDFTAGECLAICKINYINYQLWKCIKLSSHGAQPIFLKEWGLNPQWKFFV